MEGSIVQRRIEVLSARSYEHHCRSTTQAGAIVLVDEMIVVIVCMCPCVCDVSTRAASVVVLFVLHSLLSSALAQLCHLFGPRENK